MSNINYALNFSRFLKNNPDLTQFTQAQFEEFLTKNDFEYLANYLNVYRFLSRLLKEGIIEKVDVSNHRNVTYYALTEAYRDDDDTTPDVMIRGLTHALTSFDYSEASTADKVALQHQIESFHGVDNRKKIQSISDAVLTLHHPFDGLTKAHSDCLETISPWFSDYINSQPLLNLKSIHVSVVIIDKSIQEMTVFPIKVILFGSRLILVSLNDRKEVIWIPLLMIVNTTVADAVLTLRPNEFGKIQFNIVSVINPPFLTPLPLTDDHIRSFTVQFSEAEWLHLDHTRLPIENTIDNDQRTISFESVDHPSTHRWISLHGGKLI
jgi:hypothetical protein